MPLNFTPAASNPPSVPTNLLFGHVSLFGDSETVWVAACSLGSGGADAVVSFGEHETRTIKNGRATVRQKRECMRMRLTPLFAGSMGATVGVPAGEGCGVSLPAAKRAWKASIATDRASGKLASRPVLERMLARLRPGATVVIWKLDRLGRSLRHLLEVVAHLEDRGVALRVLTEQIDTSTPDGKLVFHVFGALAEFERDLIRERTQAGLAAARARGRTGGRPTVLTAEKLRAAESMRAAGEPVAAIAKELGVSRATVYRALAC